MNRYPSLRRLIVKVTSWPKNRSSLSDAALAQLRTFETDNTERYFCLVCEYHYPLLH
jgi:hypothetical protein